jgi:hypothetical protein
MNQQDAIVSQVYYLTFMCGSTFFGHFLAHHQKLTTALTASDLLLEHGGSSVVGRGLVDHDQQHCHAPTVKPKAPSAVVSS